MSNLFDSDNYPGQVPDKLYVGNRWAWKKEDIVSDYPPASYALTYSFRLLSSAATEIQLTSSVITESSTAYIIEVPSATTASYTKGQYKYQEYITRSADSERIILSTGYVNLISNLDADTSDPREFWTKVLDSTNALIENRATIDQSSMSIAGRSLNRMTPEELFTMRDRANYELNKLIKKDRINKGRATGTTIKARF